MSILAWEGNKVLTLSVGSLDEKRNLPCWLIEVEESADIK
jgi:hypothetical protein